MGHCLSYETISYEEQEPTRHWENVNTQFSKPILSESDIERKLSNSKFSEALKGHDSTELFHELQSM